MFSDRFETNVTICMFVVQGLSVCCPREARDGLKKEKFSMYFLTSSKSIKLFPCYEFCRDKNKWWSDGAMSDEYGG